MSYNLSFISDTDLYNHVKDTVNKYRFKIGLHTLNNNILDPIKLTFDAMIYQNSLDNIALEAILQDEVRRQIDKSNTNHIGYFHQNIFQYIGKEEGWSVSKKGFDVENLKKSFFIEMKNKHNTMNSSSSAKTYMRMQNKIIKNPQATCMLVEVIAKNSQNIPWTCTVDDHKMCDDRIRRISIDKFYEIVTNDKTAFMHLCQVLPTVISDVVKSSKGKLIENTVIEDLRLKEVDNILQNLYLLAFKTYQGFSCFTLTK